MQHYLLWSPTMFVPLALMALVMVALILYRRDLMNTQTLMLALFGLNTAQLLVFAFSWLPIVETKRYPIFPQTPSIQHLQGDSTQFRVLPLWDAASQRVFQPNTLDIYGVSMIQGYESLFPTNASTLAASIGEHPTSQQLRLAGLTNVKYYATSSAMTLHHTALSLVEIPSKPDGVRLWRNAFWKDRAYLAWKSEVVASPDEQLRRMADTNAHAPTFDGSTVLLTETPPEVLQTGLQTGSETDSVLDSAQANSSVHITNAENNRVQIEVQSHKAGFLVLADTWYPGWQASVNGRTTPVLRANYVLRAVTVPAGKSVVEFRFAPPLFRYGAWMSAVGLAVLVLLVAWEYYRNEKQAKAAKEAFFNRAQSQL
jgi:hypothetical protein